MSATAGKLWDRSNTIGMAVEGCAYCKGNGTRATYKGSHIKPCNCVFHRIFRACLARFRDCAQNGTPFGTVSWEFCAGPGGRRVYSRKQEEFMADFCLIAKRVLSEADYKIFRFYFLLGADWKMCAARLKLDRGNFFHAVYRVERILGKAFAEVQPYPLYPLDEYFGGTVKKKARTPEPVALPAARPARKVFNVTGLVMADAAQKPMVMAA